MSNPCEGCGSCCTIFTLSDVDKKADYLKNGYTPEYQMSEENARTLKWLEEDIEEIKYRDILNYDMFDIRGHLHYGASIGSMMVWFKRRNIRHFQCNLYDPETQKCKDYENRPSVCVGFPYEGVISCGWQMYKQCNLFDITSEERAIA